MIMGTSESFEGREDVGQARRGVSQLEDFEETFLAPVSLPGVPQRYYYLFQQPIVTSPALLKV